METQRITTEPGGPVVSYADVLDRATPSVVAVYTSQIVSVAERDRPGSLRELYERYYFPDRFRDEDAPVREEKRPLGVGSGVIFTEDGYVVTNNHVIRDQRGEIADEIKVRLGDDREFLAEVIGADPKTDVAVLKIESDQALPVVTIADSDLLRVGDVVFAIGNPLGVGLTATQGIVSATGRQSLGILGRGAYEDFIQTDAAINPGNSGGALIDAAGRLIGINTAILSGNGGNIGIGLAIPSQIVLNVMKNLIENGEVPRGMLGLYPEDLTRDLADAFGLSSTNGALVNQVMMDSPADKAGIQHGDIILKIEGKLVESASQLRLLVSQTLPGTKVSVELVREGETMTIPVVLGSVSGKQFSQSGEPLDDSDSDVIEGVTLNVLTDDLREQYSVPEEIDGVIVTEVDFESPYSESFVPGLVLIEINGEPSNTMKAVESSIMKGVNRLYTWTEGVNRYMILRVK